MISSLLCVGARITMNNFCGEDNFTVCDAFRQHPEELVKSIKQLKVSYAKVSNRDVFDNKHDGLISYNKYVVGLENGNAVYKAVSEHWVFPSPALSMELPRDLF